MTKEEIDLLVKEVGEQAAAKIKAQFEALEKNVKDGNEKIIAGLMTTEQYEAHKKTIAEELSEANKKYAELEKAMKAQGTEMLKLQEVPKGTKRTLEDFIEKEIGPKIKEMREKGSGKMEFTSTQLKAAGITSISNSVSAMAGSALTSPYLPGIGGGDLELFEIVRNPNWIINKVDLGRTNQVRLAWINETSTTYGTPDTNIAEGGLKPITQHTFQVEYSTAKKAAAYIELTEEFDTDLPGLATAVRRMLEQDVMRAFDDAIQTAVIAAARPYEITGLTHLVDAANKYDALGAELAQIAFYNFIANTVALNPVTEWEILMQKEVITTSGPRGYLDPPFWGMITPKLVEATKVAINYALTGDLKQYKVDLYKEFTLRVGWINDEFINNKFIVLGELRYHSYISDTRKKAIVYDNLDTIIAAIRSGS